jgi:uncharacterized protein (TIGR03437 family)
LAERLGDIVLRCSGNPGASVTANLSVLLPVSITNRIAADSFSSDASLTIDTGSGPVPAAVSGFVANQNISFSGVQFTFPPSGTVTLTIDNLRADVNQLGLVQQAPIQAYISSNLALANNPVNVAFAQQSLLATSMNAGVNCVGSPAPATVSMSGLIAAKTAEQTTRVTEGFAQAFQPKDSTSDTGTRFLLTYSNFPTGAVIYVPDAVTGSSATVPTDGGDLGSPATVGQYSAGSQTLLLVRVLNAAADGTGGTFASLPPANSSGVIALDGANPVALTNGSGYAVYEVVAANPSATESAQIPTYLVIPAYSTPATAHGGVTLAPVSTVSSGSTTAAIPRFAAVQPASDCTADVDCNASYYPLLKVIGTALAVTATAGGSHVGAGNLTIENTRGGILNWSASVIYSSGTGWLLFTESAGINGALVQVVVDPSTLTPGTYQATVVIDGGPIAGSQSFPLTLTVKSPVASQPTVEIRSVTNAADFHSGPLVPGELAAVFGSNLGGQNVSVTFDGTASTLLYTGAQQINLRVPAQLTGKSSTQMVVSVDGIRSAPFTVPLTAVQPAIFTPGVLNQDDTLNSATHPALPGTVLQVFGTGMPDSGGVVTVQIQNRKNLVPLYAGAAPGLPGVQQVNVAVPADLQGSTANLMICVQGIANQQYCSQPASIALKQ